MATAGFELDYDRELLSQAIVDALQSWPELQRQVFVRSHYRGESVETISKVLGMTAADVRNLLDLCDHQLRSALRAFREATHDRACGERSPRPILAANGSVH